MTKITTASSKLAAFVACREALVTVAYQDGPNKSIGFGSNSKDLQAGDTITIQDAFKRLKDDLVSREKYVAKGLKVDVTQNQFDAIVDLYYQNANKAKGTLNVLKVVNSLSPEDLAKQYDTVNDRLNRGDAIDSVSSEFQKYDTNASGTIILGLLMRRRMEVDMFWRGEYGDLSSILVFQGNPRIVRPTTMPFDWTTFS